MLERQYYPYSQILLVLLLWSHTHTFGFSCERMDLFAFFVRKESLPLIWAAVLGLGQNRKGTEKRPLFCRIGMFHWVTMASDGPGGGGARWRRCPNSFYYVICMHCSCEPYADIRWKVGKVPLDIARLDACTSQAIVIEKNWYVEWLKATIMWILAPSTSYYGINAVNVKS